MIRIVGDRVRKRGAMRGCERERRWLNPPLANQRLFVVANSDRRLASLGPASFSWPTNLFGHLLEGFPPYFCSPHLFYLFFSYHFLLFLSTIQLAMLDGPW